MAHYKVFAVSDGTGSTAEGVLRAALTQFDASLVTITRYGGILTPTQIRQVVQEAADVEGFIVHTLVSEELRHVILTEGRAANVTTIDLLGPMLARLADLLDSVPREKPGLFRTFDEGYIQRIEAIDFTVRHDDGERIDDLDQAEIVLVGVSRTSKTPLSIYLAYRGWKVANVPLVLGIEPPKQLFHLPRQRVVGLTVRPERLRDLRLVRMEHLGTIGAGYADLETIHKEMAFAFEIFDRRRDWPLVDVTAKPIEEAAAEVVSLLGRQAEHRIGQTTFP
jgi:hypothetical protein